MGQLNGFPAADSFLLGRQKLRALWGAEGAWAALGLQPGPYCLPLSTWELRALFLSIYNSNDRQRAHAQLRIPLHPWKLHLFKSFSYICLQGRRHCQHVSASLWVLWHPRKAVCPSNLSPLMLPVKGRVVGFLEAGTKKMYNLKGNRQE